MVTHSVAEPGPAPTEEEVLDIFGDFPRAYWYACDAWMKAMDKGGNFRDPITLTKDLKIHIVNLKNENGKTSVQIRMGSEDDLQNFHSFVFEFEKARWKATKGFVVEGKKRTDLYVPDFFTISLKPFVQAEVDQLVKKTGVYAPDYKKKPGLSPPVFEALTGEGLAGSGFHLEWKGKRFIVCSLHQFSQATPKNFTAMEAPEIEQIIPVVTRAHQQIDVQVLTYDSDWLEGQPALEYSPEALDLQVGSPVFALEGNKWRLGHVIATEDHALMLEMEQPFAAAGTSGSPLICGQTGKVAAVILAADSPTEARVVKTEKLKLPQMILEDLTVSEAPSEIFGISSSSRLAPEIAIQVQKESIHPGVFGVQLGMTHAEVMKIRPDSTKELQWAYLGKSSHEQFAPNYLSSFGQYTFSNGKLTSVGFSSLRSATALEMGNVAAFFITFFGAPDSIFERDSNVRQPGNETIVMHWVNDKFSAVLSFRLMDVKTMKFEFEIRKGKHQVQKMLNVKDSSPLSVKPEEIRRVFTEWGNVRLKEAATN